ncbi:unnamed protein product [Tuber aestivum]|uniref:Uncharacterized protein n=1 Tax=Tuber aestivum TaxID=59557 RepID=A0A292Q889_9PEZI|nr:unnamed protein product [Tuber aestivum]
MSDDLLSHHHLISYPSFIPLSNNPTWYTTQLPKNRSKNRTYLFLPTPTSVSSFKPRIPKFLAINPNWSIYSFDRSILELYTKATRTSQLYEMRMGGGGQHGGYAGGESGIGRVVEDGEWFRQTYKDEATLVDEEDVLSVVDPSGVRLAFATCLGDAGRLLVTKVEVAEGVKQSVRGVEVIRKLLGTVVDIAERGGLRAWINIPVEDAIVVGALFEMGFVVNRTLWLVESDAEVVDESGVEDIVVGSGRVRSTTEKKNKVEVWKLPDWEGGMSGWKEQWSAALDRIMAGGA